MNRIHTVGILFVMVVAAVFVGTQVAVADVIKGSHDWDAVGDGLLGWTNLEGIVELDRAGAGGDPGGWLEITFPASAAPGDVYDIVYTPAANLFAGTWTNEMWVEFDFWAESAVPDHVQVWWSSTNADIWMSEDLALGGTNEWTTLSASFLNWNDWTADVFGMDESDYLDDLASIEWIGVYIWRGATDEQVYGIDNMKLMIPEPAEWIMLGMAIVTSAASLRKKRKKPCDSVGA